MNKGIKEYKSGNSLGAIKTLEQSWKVDPTNDRASYYQGIIYNELARNSGDLQYSKAAVQALERSVNINGEDANSHYQLGVAYKDTDRLNMAINSFTQANRLDPGFGEAYFRSGLIYRRQSKFNQAQESYREAIQTKPSMTEPFEALAQLYIRFNQPALAAQVLKNAISNHEDQLGFYRDLGQVYEGQEQYDRAISLYEKALKEQPNDSHLQFLIAQCYFKNKDYRMAEKRISGYLNRSHPKTEKVRIFAARKIHQMLLNMRKSNSR